MILEVLGQDPVHIDELAHSVDMDITSLLEILLKLELKYAVQQIGGKQFVGPNVLISIFASMYNW